MTCARFACAVLAAAVLAEPAIAQWDHLVPPSSAYATQEPSYQTTLAQVFPCPICGYPIHALAMPAFDPEWAVWAGPKGLEHVVCLAIAKGQVHYALQKGKVDPSEFRPEPRCEPITADLFRTLRQAWLTVLQKTRFPEAPADVFVLEGTIYYFSLDVPRVAFLEGESWSAASTSPAGRLEALTENLRAFVAQPSSEHQSKLGELAKEIASAK
jgi:hypothetical protein